MEYFLHILILIGIYTILSGSLDLLAGHTGLLSIAHAVFYGLGAYTSALMTVHMGSPFLVSTLCGMFIAGVFSLFVSLPSLRLHGDYFVILTFGLQMILYSVFNNWTSLTNGPLGISGISPPRIFGWVVQSKFEFIILIALFITITYGIVILVSTSPFGRVLRAIRENEIFAQSMGKNTLYFKVLVIAVSSILAGLAGSLYAHYITYIDPSSFTVMESILVLSMVIIGGAGSYRGSFIGAVILVTLPEVLGFIGLPSSVAANLRQIIYGALLVIMMIARPQGLVGRYNFGG